MNNQEGKIWYGIGLDTTPIQSDANKVKGIFKNIGDEAEKQSGRIDAGFKNLFAFAGGTAAAGMFIKQLVDVRGEFQQLEIAFTTMLKSKERSDVLMRDITEFAATTPFDLKQVAGGTKQLLAYGFAAEDMKKNLSMIGNVAAGVGSQINDIIYLYGTLKASGRVTAMDINQFAGRGIPIYEALAQVMGVTREEIRGLVSDGKVGFSDIEKAFQSMTNEGGMFYNLMQEQSKSLSGQMSNLGDSIDKMFNDIGKSQEGLLSDGISGIAFLVENYETVGKIIGGLVATYGAYKAAVIVLSVVQKTNTLIQLESALAGRTLTIAQGLQAIATKGLTAATAMLNRTMLANPYVLVATAVIALVSALAIYKSTQDDVIENNSAISKAESDITSKYKDEEAKVKSLSETVRDNSLSINQRQQALTDLQKIVPGYHASLTAEGKLINDNKVAIDDYLKSIEKKIKYDAYSEQITNLTKQKIIQEGNLKMQAKGLGLKKLELGKGEVPLTTEEILKDPRIKSEGYKETIAELTKLKELIDGISDTTAPSGPSKTTSEIEAEKKALEDKKKAAKKAKEDFDKQEIDEQKRLDDAELDLMRSKISDKKDLIDLEYEQTIDAINKNEEEFKAKAKAAGIENPDVSIFASQRKVAGQKRVSDKNNVDKEELEKNQKEITDLLLQYSTEREKIVKKYQEDIAKLEASGNQAMADSARAEMDKQLSEIEVGKIKELDIYNMAIDEQLKLSKEMNDKLIEDVKRRINESKDLTQEDKDKLLAGVDFANMSKASNSIDGVIKSVNGLRKAKEDAAAAEMTGDLKGAAKASKEIDKFQKSLKDYGSELIDYFDQAANGVIGVTGQLVGMSEEEAQMANDVVGAVSSAGTLAVGIATGDISSIIKGAIGLVSNLIKIFDEKGRDIAKKQKASEKEVDNLSDAYDRLGRSIDKSLGSDVYALQKEQIVNLRKQIEANNEWIVQEQRKKKKKQDQEAIDSKKSEIESLKNEIDDINQSIIENLAQTTAKDLAGSISDALVEAAKNGEDSFSAMANVINDKLKNAIVNSLEQQFLEKQMNSAVNYLSSAMQDGSLSDSEKSMFSEMVTKAGNNYNEALKAYKDILGSSEESRQGASKGIAQASQDSVNELNGRFTAIQGHTYGISESMKILQANSAQSLKYLAGIETNTARLEAIEKGIEIINLKGVKLQ